jgi:hypothetical protein
MATRGRNWTPAERAIIYAGVFGGLTLERINELLGDLKIQQTSPRTLIDTGYERIKRNYCPKFAADPGLLGECIEHPKPEGEL